MREPNVRYQQIQNRILSEACFLLLKAKSRFPLPSPYPAQDGNRRIRNAGQACHPKKSIVVPGTFCCTPVPRKARIAVSGNRQFHLSNSVLSEPVQVWIPRQDLAE